jgi:putative NIF3 family GTP cyclohydrolase 1 type 2
MIDRRTIMGAMAATAIIRPGSLSASGAQITAREVFDRIKTASRQPWDPNATDDRIIFGDRAVAVTGIATCFTPTLDVLRRAQAAGLNYIIPHEASFYERYDDTASSGVRDDDVVVAAKRRFLTANKMVIQRMHSHAHSLPGDAIIVGLIHQLGWEGQRVGDVVGVPCVQLPLASARSVGLHIKERLGLRTLRMFGKPEREIAKIGISVGMPGENLQIAMLESGLDAVMLGEVREPEVLGHAQDMAYARDITVFFSGHNNEDAGMGVVADWLTPLFPTLPVRWLPTADPFTNPA